MGRDKALIPVGGTPLAVRVADALAAAGATRVVAIGGDLAALRTAGLDAFPDDDPGEGPLTGILTALGTLTNAADAPGVVFVAACDLLAPEAAAVRATVAALATADESVAVAVPLAGERRQWLHAAWRAAARSRLARAFAAGERSVHGAVAVAELRLCELPLAPAAVADADVPADLPTPGPE
jgi:molybdopterin-guanine dinucleotide biosynthesis protein A